MTEMRQMRRMFLVMVTAMVMSLALAGMANASREECEKNWSEERWEAAFEACHAAASAGDGKTWTRVGILYKDGRGTARDYKQAMQWFRKSAESGSPRGMYWVGWLNLKGWGVPVDEKEAARWLKQSAERGFFMAQFRYGVLLYNGAGVDEDHVESYKWLWLMLESGAGPSRIREQAAHRLHWFDSQMTYADIDEAKRRAREWKPVE